MIPPCDLHAAYLEQRDELVAAAQRVLDSGWYVLGKEVEAFEQEFSDFVGTPWALGVASGTDALELALRAYDVGAGDWVATVSHSAVATAAAISRVGAQPCFVDIDPLRYTMSPDSLAELLERPAGARIKAVIVVHLYGQSADLPALLSLTRTHGLPLIEDCAQAHGATLDGRQVGAWGEFGCFSFYPTKNLGALGDGGAICGFQPAARERMLALRQYGWHERFISTEIGINSRLDELQAALLRVRLRRLATNNQRRREIAASYNAGLIGLEIGLPSDASNGGHVYHQYVVQSPKRDLLHERLAAAGIGTQIHYPAAIHQQPAYADPALRPLALPHTEALIPNILSLPMFPQLDDTAVDKVTTAVRNALS